MRFKEFYRKSLLKPGDIIIIAVLILASFIPLVVFSLQQETGTEAPKTSAVLRVDGTEIKSFDLSKDQTYKYIDDDGDYNLIEVADGRIRIKDANCGDQICVRRGWASKKGETIVCLPHKLVIEIQTNDSGGGDDLIY